MSTVLTPRLSYEDFKREYEQRDCTYEYWYGEAVLKGLPTVAHGVLQQVLGRMLSDLDYVVMSEVEFRVVTEARPKPDLLATRKRIGHEYLQDGVEIVVEILADREEVRHLLQKCRKYSEWGCDSIYVVDPDDQTVYEWVNGSLLLRESLATIPAPEIWNRLTRELGRLT